MPLLTVLIPTIGRPRNLKTTVDILSQSLKVDYEIVIYLNNQDSEVLNEIVCLFETNERLKIVPADIARNSADESTLEGLKHASGEWVWILGDDDYPLAYGIKELEDEISTPETDVLFFESRWISPNSNLMDGSALTVTSHKSVIPIKLFILLSGFNYLPTGMGKLCIKRNFFDLDLWENLISVGGPVFSYVTCLLGSGLNSKLKYICTPIIRYQSSNYHFGDVEVWETYTKSRNMYRHQPWTLDIVRQLRYLIEKGFLSHNEVGLSIVNERQFCHRFIDEIYNHLFFQMRCSNYFSKKEHLEVLEFISKAAPDRVYINSELMNISDNLVNTSLRIETANKLKKALDSEVDPNPFLGLEVERWNSYIIYRHPKGYIAINLTESPDNHHLFFRKIFESSDGVNSFKIFDNLHDARNYVSMQTSKSSTLDIETNQNLIRRSLNSYSNLGSLSKTHMLLRIFWHMLPGKIRKMILKSLSK